MRYGSIYGIDCRRTMKRGIRREKKSYALCRMVQAIGRAITAESAAAKNKAARWAAAWGLMGGIYSPGVRLRRDVLADRRRR